MVGNANFGSRRSQGHFSEPLSHNCQYDALPTSELKGYLKSSKFPIVLNAALLLARRHATECIPDLVAVLGRFSPGERGILIQTFDWMGKAAESLVPLLLEEGERRPENACRVLKGIGTESSAKALLKLSRSADPDVRNYALHTIGEMGIVAESIAPQIYNDFHSRLMRCEDVGDYRIALSGLGYSESKGDFSDENLIAKRNFNKFKPFLGYFVDVCVGEQGSGGLHIGFLKGVERHPCGVIIDLVSRPDEPSFRHFIQQEDVQIKWRDSPR